MPRSISQYSNMVPRLLGQNYKCFQFLLGQRKPRSHVRILIYRAWPIYQFFRFDTGNDYGETDQSSTEVYTTRANYNRSEGNSAAKQSQPQLKNILERDYSS